MRGPHPASSLQRELASRLADPELCPTGDSRDGQKVVDDAGLQAMAHLPEGCHRITSTIDIPPGTRLIAAGAETTILYRDPKESYSQPILRLRGGAGVIFENTIKGF